MLIQKLREYSQRLDLPPVLYDEVAVRYILDLDCDGRLLNPQLTDTAVASDRRQRRGQLIRVPQVQKTSGIRATLFADNAEYTLGLARDPSKAQRAEKAHAAYLDVLHRCVEVTGDSGATAVLAFLSDNPASKIDLPADFDSGARMTFRVDGRYVGESPDVQRFWADWNGPADAPHMQCLICGQIRPVLNRLQAKVKGIPGGQTSGTSIISANASAFESFGLGASLIAPTCSECGEQFTKAINQLIGNEHYSYRLAGSVFIYWTAKERKFNPLHFLDQPDEQEVRTLLDSLKSGALNLEIDPTPFYATVLSGSGGRAVVRDWIDTTVGRVQQRLAEWHHAQRIVDQWGQEARSIGLYQLAGATARRMADVPTPTLRLMVRTALTGTPLPLSLLAQVVRRTQADRNVSHPQAALIKLVLMSRGAAGDLESEDALMTLEQGLNTPAYHCGRLMAVIEEAQRQAISGVRSGTGASVVDRYFAKASTVPSMVFGPLVASAQAHLSKLERDNRGAHFGLQKEFEDVLGHIQHGFPRTLKPEQQGEFVLGYYHQRAANRAAALEARDRRNNGRANNQ